MFFKRVGARESQLPPPMARSLCVEVVWLYFYIYFLLVKVIEAQQHHFQSLKSGGNSSVHAAVNGEIKCGPDTQCNSIPPSEGRPF